MSHNPPRRAASRRASIQLLTAPHRRSLQLPHGDVDSFCAASSLFASADRAPSCLPPGHLPLVSEVSLDPYRAATEAEEVQRSLTKDHASSSCTAPCIPKSSSKSNLSGLCRSNSCGNNSGNLGSIHAAAKSPRTYLSALLVVVLLCCTAFEAGLWSCSHSSGIPTLTTTPKGTPRIHPSPAMNDRRSLIGDALSNSNGCLATIPKCEAGACATRNVMGVSRWVCLRCLANYQPVIDASGQDNILQCVCPKGFFEPDANSTSCLRCTQNNYCPGGDQVENPVSRGTLMQCGGGLVTRNTGARSQTDCVAPAGHARSSPNEATPCSRSEYAPMFNRLGKCITCQSGLEEPLRSGYNASQRDGKRAVCMLPPGKYMSQGLVRICPQGFYRQNYVAFDAPVGTLCLPCNPGITTAGAGAKTPAECNRVLPGYGIDKVFNVTSQLDIPMLPQGDSGLPNATICDIAFYSGGGYCLECPFRTVTQAKGAKSIEECMVPPGYYLTPTMQTCTAGFFREGWVMYSSSKSSSCSPCGTNIDSEPRDLDENPLVANGTLVRATSTSCFINAGHGMISQGKNLFVGIDCPENTYGAAGKLYGWAAAPCKPCARNMITDGLTNSNNSDSCINPDGFGYATEGASRCAPGFYSLKASRKPCQQCPSGRTTADDTAAQRLITDCFVKPGFGVASSHTNSTDAFNIDTTGLDNATIIALPVLECPVGYFSGGHAVDTKCTQCPAGSTTQAVGSTSVTDCNVCVAGFGKPDNSSSTCLQCDYGTYQPGGLVSCQACPQTSFYTPVDGAGTTLVSDGTTTFRGAIGAESCVPMRSQLSPEAGQAFFTPDAAVNTLLVNSTAADLGACLAACPANSCCLAQYDVTGQVCKVGALEPAAGNAAGLRLQYKLPPSTLGSASSITQAGAQQQQQELSGAGAVRAKTMASGIYAHCSVPAAAADAWKSAGTNLGVDARTFSSAPAVQTWDVSSEADCRSKCDASNVCWGFFYDSATSSCLYRGGVDAIKTRSFFVLPSAVDLGSLNWQVKRRLH